MGASVLVGTQKGAMVLRSDAGRSSWRRSPLQLKGWLVTSFARAETGRTYAAVTHDVWGSTVMASDDLEHWEQLEGAPRYEASEVGNPGHNRIIGAMDPMEQFTPGGRHVDQIWKLRAVGDRLYAGVSEAGLFTSDDQGKSWQVLPGLNRHPDRDSWGPGFGGLCAHTVLVDERDPLRIWVGISAAGAFRSDDGGKTFAAKNDGVNPAGDDGGFCVHGMAHDPSNADVIYRQDHRGVYKTENGGESWHVIENGLPVSVLGDEHRCTFGFAVDLDPASNAVFVLPLENDSLRFPHDGRLAVYRSRDGGESWLALSQGLPSQCWANVLRGAMSLDKLAPCGVYFGTTGGSVFGSADGGDSWSQLVADLPKILCVEAFED